MFPKPSFPPAPFSPTQVSQSRLPTAGFPRSRAPPLSAEAQRIEETTGPCPVPYTLFRANN